MMTDWESDPELKGLRDDFVRSFESRRAALVPVLESLRTSRREVLLTSQGALLDLRVIAHNLAGTALTYGFARLGEVAVALDDYLSLARETSADRVLRFSLLLDQALAAAKGGIDPEISAQALEELTSCVESLASAAKP